MVHKWWKKIKARKKLDKISGDLLRVIYAAIIEKLLATNMSPDEINKWLKDVGKKAGEWLFLIYSRKIGIHAYETNIEKITENICLAIELFSGARAHFYLKSPETIMIEVEECVFCGDINLSDDLRALKYCEILAGMIEGAYEMRDVNVFATERMCIPTSKKCIIEIRILKTKEKLP